MSKKALILASVASMIDQFNISNIETLQSLDYEVDVVADFVTPGTITKERSANLQECLMRMGVHVHHVAIPRSLNPKLVNSAYKAVKKLVSSEKYDLIHCQSPIGGAICRLAARKARKQGSQVIYTAHGFHFFKGAPLKNWMLFYPIEKFLGKYTDILITINKEDYDRAKSFGANKVVYVPGIGVDTGKFSNESCDKASKRAELDVSEDDFILLSVGELNTNKNHKVVIEALEELQKAGKINGLKYLICGRGPLEEQLRERIDAYGLSNHVQLLGYRSDVSQIYSIADLFVFMSFREGLPVALMEAMACGLPVVCSNIRGNTDLIENGYDGVIVNNDPTEVAEAILKLMMDERIRNRLAREVQMFVKKFDKDVVQKQMKELYSQI